MQRRPGVEWRASKNSTVSPKDSSAPPFSPAGFEATADFAAESGIRSALLSRTRVVARIKWRRPWQTEMDQAYFRWTRGDGGGDWDAGWVGIIMDLLARERHRISLAAGPLTWACLGANLA